MPGIIASWKSKRQRLVADKQRCRVHPGRRGASHEIRGIIDGYLHREAVAWRLLPLASLKLRSAWQLSEPQPRR